jgi:anti-sigma-K factor RskA
MAMIAIRDKAPEREDIETLLPWHAAGTLSRRDAERVEQALATDAELARRYELVREELAETIHLNETLGAPSARAMQKLFAAIDAESANENRRTSFDFGGWLAGLIEQVSPRTLAWSAAAAGLAIVLQAGLLAGFFVAERGATYQTASYDQTSATPQGSFALVRFNPEANAADITKFFAAHKATLVEGPQPGGVYRIRVAPTPLSQGELAKVVAQMAEDKGVVAFIVPARSQ